MFRNTVISRIWARMPAMIRGITSAPSALLAEMLMCMPLPGWPLMGLGEKSAARPLRTATLSTTVRKVTALSAAVSGWE